MPELVDETKALNGALAKAQGAFLPITQGKRVEVKTKAGDRYSYTYAPLEDILAAVRPALAQNGLAISQLLEDNGSGPSLRTELRHEAGGLIGSSFHLPSRPETPQQLGSLLTYLRRYTITALLGIATEEDDDGQQAARAKPKQQLKRPTERPAEEKNLLSEIKARYERLAELEQELGVVEPTDWISWSRSMLKVGPDVWLDAEQMRALIEMLDREQSKLIAEIAAEAASEYGED